MMAHKFFDLAASQGLKKAVKGRSMVKRKMTPEQIAKVTNNEYCARTTIKTNHSA